MKFRNGIGLAALLGLTTMATAIGIDGTLPAMPAMVETFGTTRTSVQTTLSLFMVGVAIGQIVHGPLSDRFGRKPVIVAGMLITAAATAGCAAAQSLEAFMAFRFLHGISASAGFIVARAAIRDRYEHADAARVISLVLFFHGFAPLISPVVGAHLVVAFGWNAVFAFIACYSALVALAFGLIFRETLERPDPDALQITPMLRNFREISRSAVFWAYTGCAAACFGILFSFLSASSHVIITFFGESETAYSYMFGGCMIGTIIGMLINSRLIPRYGTDRLLRWGVWQASLFGLLLLILSLAGAQNWLAVIGPMFFCMIAFSLIYPQTLAGALQPFPHAAGAASSLVGLVQQLTGAVTGMVVAALSTGGTQTALAGGVLFWALFALGVYLAAIRRLTP